MATSSKKTSPAAQMLKWYRKHGRDLPWRKTRNPYKILVSEVMLQQTQVERVKLYYKTWLKTFPTWKKLAQASNADVIHAWAGLGYNRRALALRDIAKQVIERGVPANREEWIQLKGIGPYTSGALAAFAFKQRELPIDTNIRRVLGRFYFGIPFPNLKDDVKIDALTDAFLPKRGHYYDVPQAIFDLATMICTKTPNCAACPLKKECNAAKKFLSGKIITPKRTIKKANETKHRDKPYPDRIYRGRILKLVREQTNVHINIVGTHIDPDYDQIADETWVHNMIKRLEKDGLIKSNGKTLSL
ncbi:MAG: A/G-specific adenine glycosylase [bacterium]|jgi:A/G-specific adenine glycosylase|nr:A/G-specific adenine glycosylase [bacterium]